MPIPVSLIGAPTDVGAGARGLEHGDLQRTDRALD